MVRRSERTIVRTLHAVEAAGWLEIERCGGRGNLTMYKLNLDKLKGCQDVTLLGKQKRVTLVQKRVTLTPIKGDIDDIPPHPLLGRNVKETLGNKTPPNPPQAGGAWVENSDQPSVVTDQEKPRLATVPRDQAIDLAVDQVMQGCGFTAVRLRRKLREVVLQQDRITDTSRHFESPAEISAAMVDAWDRYTKQGTRLRVHMSATNFFMQGAWLRPSSWHWDNETIRAEKLAMEATAGRNWG
jgi:hypothetical protein